VTYSGVVHTLPTLFVFPDPVYSVVTASELSSFAGSMICKQSNVDKARQLIGVDGIAIIVLGGTPHIYGCGCRWWCLVTQGSAFRAVGAPTEAALLVLAEKLGLPDATETAAARKKRTATPEEHPQPVTQVGAPGW
jgi:hypothetical protein